jgi:hypothetical protein
MITIKMKRVTTGEALTPEIRTFKQVSQYLKNKEHFSVEDARVAMLALVDAIGEYETPADRSRALAFILSPGMVRGGILRRDDCPPYKIEPTIARDTFITLLVILYGKDMELGCPVAL